MGGLGSTYLGGRLPGFFGTVASLSGFVDPQYFADITDPGMGLTALARFHGDNDPDPVDGPPNGFYAYGHNPAQLTMNLEETRVFLSSGTGIPSETGLTAGVGVLPNIASGSVLEAPIIYPMNQLYHSALAAAGVNVTYQTHPGGHDIPDFMAEEKAMVSWGLFKTVPTNPTSWSNDTVATRGQIWDVGYTFAKPPRAVVSFRQAGSSLSISTAGSPVSITSGSCVIHTPTPATINLATCA
jgi:hypothetical protein